MAITPLGRQTMSDNTFYLSIEPVAGGAFCYWYHLGTIESVARDCAARIFAERNASPYRQDLQSHVMKTRTVALYRNGRMFDVFDGVWFNQTYAEAAK